MTDHELASAILNGCSTHDTETNGCNLDRIIADFLRTQGFTASAHAFENVEAWRS